jgi:DNA-binding NarL/FixJ family response regulator
MRIFIADGDLLYRKLIKFKLRNHPSILIEEAGDGFSAFDKIIAFNPDLLIVADQLNLISGIQLLRRLGGVKKAEAFSVLLSSSKNFVLQPCHIDIANAIIYKHSLCKELSKLIRTARNHLPYPINKQI